ncbi:MAG: aminoglycoside 3'-phosphotransferase [Clostridiales bacterium]|nr:aminoglycoside 3'-phosphotransferase [Clostridiales bacterium]
MLSFLPETLSPMLRGGRFTPIAEGCSPARVYRVTDAAVFPDCFLKIDIPRPRGLDREAAACIWLRGRFPAPEVLYFGEAGGNLYLLTTALTGQGACFGENARQPERMARMLARALSRLHQLSCADCPLDNSAPALLEYARTRISPSASDPEGCSALTLHRELTAVQPPDEPVFCHGDFCLPNVLFENGELTGIIDLGDAGAGNRHLDLSQCCWSLRHNFGEERFADAFLDEYGRDRVDPGHMKWFSDLYRFF